MSENTKKTINIISVSLLATIIIALFGYIFNCIAKQDNKIENIESEMNTYSSSYTDIMVRLSVIESDLKWIRGVLQQEYKGSLNIK
jgi:flagellar basal body-associated protein FliL